MSPQQTSKNTSSTLKDITIDEIIDLQGVYNAINKGTPASDFFEAVKAEPEAIGVVAAAAATTTQPSSAQVNQEQAAARVTRKKAEPKVEPKAEPQPEPKVEPEPEPEAVQEPEPEVQPEPAADQPANVDESIGSDDDELF